MHEDETQAVEEAPAETPTLEERLKVAEDRNVAIVEAHNKAVQRANSIETALTLAHAKTAQLEANLRVLRVQRDLFMEREADAAVNADLNNTRLTRDIKSLQTQLEETKNSIGPLNTRLYQATTALQEVRDLFGKVKAKQKEAERELASSHTVISELEEQLQETRSSLMGALTWYADVTGRLRFSVPFRFTKETGRELESIDILFAFDEYQKGTEFEQATCLENFVDFLVTPSSYISPI